MLYKENQGTELEKELFENPSAAYRGTPFWSWNCRITKQLIEEQLGVFKEMGFGGAHLHPRTGLETDYLSDEFMDMVRYADDVCKRKKMLCWLYDEDRYPSGAAGGIVTENVRYRARHLLLTGEKKPDLCVSKEDFDRRVEAGEKPAGYYLTAYRIKTRDGYLISYRQIKQPMPESDSECERESEGRLVFAYVELMRESPWFNDQTYIDVMNKEAVQCFLRITHETYYAALGDEFGKSIPAIFTDEPQLKGSMALASGESTADVTLSFTDDFPDTYAAQYGYDILSVLPEVMIEDKEKPAIHRYRYHEHLCERFVSAYSDTIADWCEQHNLMMTGHYMSEPTLYSQTLRLGEAMRCYRKQQLPGVDILCGDPEYSTIKQAASVSRQEGREGVTSELYGVTNWDFDFKGHKLQGDWQAALGVTVRVPHLSFMSMEGEAKRDWPASINYQSPWYKKYSYIENYFARVATALTRGHADVRIAVLHPIESYWIAYGPVKETGGYREQLDKKFADLIQWLLFGLLDFDFVAESLLPTQYLQTEKGMQVGAMNYQVILIPSLMTIRKTTVDILREYQARGGKIIFMGDIPKLVDGELSSEAVALAHESICIPFDEHALLLNLADDRLLDITGSDGKRSSNLFYQLRNDGSAKWLFICHVIRKTSRADMPEIMQLSLKGSYRITKYDAITGETTPVDADISHGYTRVGFAWYAEDSLLWKLQVIDEKTTDNITTDNKTIDNKTAGNQISNSKKESCEHLPISIPVGERIKVYGLVAGNTAIRVPRPEVLQTIYEPDGCTLEEPNVLLLDYAEWKLDDDEYEPLEEILRLDNVIRTRLGYPHRQDAYTQPWRVKHAPRDHRVTLKYEIESEIDVSRAFLAMERLEDARITLNGQKCAGKPEISAESGGSRYYVDSFIHMTALSGIRKGKNELILSIPYGRKTNLENIYLLGEFGVDMCGTRAVITEKARKLLFGDITRQRLPFYGGNLVYTMSFDLDKKQSIKIRIPQFSAPVIAVSLDHEEKGLIAFEPHTLDLHEVEAGSHTLDIRVYGNRFNTFGALHNCNEEFKWYGPDSYRTSGSEWSESYQLRPFGILSRVEILR